MPSCRNRLALCVIAFSVCALITIRVSQAQNSSQIRLIPGANVNMVSGTQWPNGDPFLQRQNEPSIAVSTRNPMHLLAGSNDYRTVDIPGLPTGMETGDSWLGIFRSYDGGDSWQSTLLPGYPQDTGPTSPLFGYRAAADPVMRAGTNGMFYFSGIAFDRGFNPKSTVFVARYIDLNNEEGGDPIKYLGTAKVREEMGGTYFIDKPWIAVDIPRAGYQTANLSIPGPNGTITQDFACGNVYVAWAEIVGDGIGMQSRIMFSRSTNCGASFSTPIQLSAPNTLNQGTTIAVAPDTGNTYVSWRQFPLPQNSGCVPTAFQKFVTRGGQGYWKNHPEKWPTQSLRLGSILYTKTQLINILKTPVHGDATYTLAYQLIAAKLNYLVYPDASILPTINNADAWLITHSLGTKPKDKQPGLDLSNILQQYNEGPLPLACNPLDPANEIMAVRSTNLGNNFGQATAVSNIAAFDQGTSNISFRSTAYPAMTVDATGRVYLAWATRGLATASANPDPVAGDSRIVVATCDGNSSWPSWTTPQPIDQPNVSGHQIKPALCFTAGKLFMLYYDFREDISKDFQQYIADLATLQKRHTVDVRAAVADPGQNPVFTDYSVTSWRPSDQMSRYAFLMLASNLPGDTSLFNTQLQFNPPNLPLFVGGTAPFHGDYLDIAPVPAFVIDAGGNWTFNTASSNGTTLQATWTDNRDVKGPPDGDWTKYVPPTNANSGLPSIYDPAQTVPPCQTALDAQRTGMRNQNVYNTRVSRGLFVAAPGNYKPLEPLGEMQRAFVVYVQNTTGEQKSFRLEIHAPASVSASFTQSGTVQISLDVEIAGYSSAARTVFVNGQNPQGSVEVSVFEISGVGGSQVPGGLESSVLLNLDPWNPAPADSSLQNVELHTPAIMNPAIMNPAIMNPAIMNPAIMNPAIMNPAIMNPAIMNPAIMNPAIMNPAIMNPAIMNPAIMNPAVYNPAIMNPAIMNPAIMNTAIFNPAIMNPAIMNESLEEANWVVQNNGNTTTAYSFNALLTTPQQGLIFQLLIYRLYMTPVADGCTLKLEAQQELLVNKINPDLGGSLFKTGQLSSEAGQPTFFLAPGQYAVVTLLAYPDPASTQDRTQILANLDNFHPEDVSVSLVSQAIDSNVSGSNPLPEAAVSLSSVIVPLSIPTPSVPDGLPGVAYGPVPLAGSGGFGIQTWSIVQGSLPPGINIDSSGVLSGTPTVPGIYNFTVRVMDYTQAVEKAFTMTINSVNLYFVSQPTTMAAGQNLAIQVLVQDPMNDPMSGITVSLRVGTDGCPQRPTIYNPTAVTDGSGVATFTPWAIYAGGWGFTLSASALGTSKISNDFDVIGFCPAASPSVGRIDHDATFLPNGKVLVTGGWDYTNYFSSAEIYSSDTDTWLSTNPMSIAREGHKAALLPDGKVLVTGGMTSGSPLPRQTAEIYDPASDTWAGTGSMSIGRVNFTATRLPDGRILAAGGYGGPGNSFMKTAELFDPATGTWSATGSMIVGREWHTATLLPNGTVLIVGGWDTGLHFTATAELYDPATGAWTSAGSMSLGRAEHTATLLPNGEVLVAAGQGPSGGYANTVELYDPVLGTWSVTGPMNEWRWGHTATVLQNGKVVVAGGNTSPVSYPINAEIYDPTAGTWTRPYAYPFDPSHHSATLLSNGKVLVAGRYHAGSGYNAGLFNPERVSLIFTNQPVVSTAGAPMPQVQVRAVDRNGNGISNIAVDMGIVPSKCSTCALNGTTSMTTDGSGYATFSNLRATRGGWGYRLFASAPSLGVTSASDQFNISGFCETGSMSEVRFRPTMTLLPDGKVLVAAGEDGSNVLKTVELYNPTTGTWSSTGALNVERFSHAEVLLPDGRVLVEGGNGTMAGGIQASAEIYDPAAGTWSLTGSLKEDRTEHTATLLPGGQVLVVGGQGNAALTRSTSEIYDTALGTWNYTPGTLNAARYGHTATLLPDGKVLVAGGQNMSGLLLTAEIYDPTAGTWSYTGSLNAARSLHSATLLRDGRVLVVGGESTSGWLSSAEIYNPTTGIWSYSAGSLWEGRSRHTATLFPDGRVLIAGGINNLSILSRAEIYEPISNAFVGTGSMVNSRFLHGAVLLPNGLVLVAGGSPTVTELYYPPCARYPSGYVPFVSVYYISGPNSNGDRLLVGTMTWGTWTILQSLIPLPDVTNQCFCGLVELAPGRFAIAYVLTALERSGNFGSFAGLLIDPLSGLPFPSGIIPVSRIPGIFAWRIRIITP